MRRALITVVGALLAIAVVAGCGGSSDSSSADGGSGSSTTTAASQGGSSTPAPTDRVKIADFEFSPADIEVKAGTSVTWTNSDSAPHTATSKQSGVFDTGTLKQGTSKAVTLDKPGTYAFYCEFHPTMKGTVVVR